MIMEFCQFCHFTADFADYEIKPVKREVKDKNGEKITITFMARVYIGRAIYQIKDKPVCLPCAVMGWHEATKKRTYQHTPKG